MPVTSTVSGSNLQVHVNLGTGLPPLRIEIDADGKVTHYTEGPNGDARFLTIANGGGHWEIEELHSLPEGSGLELDENGYPVIHQPA